MEDTVLIENSNMTLEARRIFTALNAQCKVTK